MNDKVIDIWKWKPARKSIEPCAIPLMVTPTQHEKYEWATRTSTISLILKGTSKNSSRQVAANLTR